MPSKRDSPLAPKPSDIDVELSSLMELARKGNEAVVPRLRELLGQEPGAWEHLGNLARQAEESWIARVAGVDLAFAEVIRIKLAALKFEIGGVEPAPLERLLVERRERLAPGMGRLMSRASARAKTKNKVAACAAPAEAPPKKASPSTPWERELASAEASRLRREKELAARIARAAGPVSTVDGPWPRSARRRDQDTRLDETPSSHR